MEDQLSSLGLVLNCVVLWNTVSMDRALAHRLNSGSRPRVRRVVTDERSIFEVAAQVIGLADWLPPEARAVG
ncbi:Tn3 family transposase [Nocardia testacea]